MHEAERYLRLRLSESKKKIDFHDLHLLEMVKFMFHCTKLLIVCEHTQLSVMFVYVDMSLTLVRSKTLLVEE